MAAFDIKLTQAAQDKARELAAEGKALRLSFSKSGCCGLSVMISPDVERVGDQVMEVDGIRILTVDKYPDLQWFGTIDYREKGLLRRGFIWK